MEYLMQHKKYRFIALIFNPLCQERFCQFECESEVRVDFTQIIDLIQNLLVRSIFIHAE